MRKVQGCFPSHAVKKLKSRPSLIQCLWGLQAQCIHQKGPGVAEVKSTVLHCKLTGRESDFPTPSCNYYLFYVVAYIDLLLSTRHWPFKGSVDRNGWPLPLPVSLLSHFFSIPVCFLISSLSRCAQVLKVTALRQDRAKSVWWHSLNKLDDIVTDLSTLMAGWLSRVIFS